MDVQPISAYPTGCAPPHPTNCTLVTAVTVSVLPRRPPLTGADTRLVPVLEFIGTHYLCGHTHPHDGGNATPMCLCVTFWPVDGWWWIERVQADAARQYIDWHLSPTGVPAFTKSSGRATGANVWKGLPKPVSMMCASCGGGARLADGSYVFLAVVQFGPDWVAGDKSTEAPCCNNSVRCSLPTLFAYPLCHPPAVFLVVCLPSLPTLQQCF